MSVFLEALKTKTLELVLGRHDHHNKQEINPELLTKFVEAQNKFGSQPKKSKKGAAK